MQLEYDLKVEEQQSDPVLEKINNVLKIQQQSDTTLSKAMIAYEVLSKSNGYSQSQYPEKPIFAEPKSINKIKRNKK